MKTLKTELQRQREQRDMAVYLDFERMRSVPGNSKTEIARLLMKKYGIYSLGTIYAIYKRVAEKINREEGQI